jgi:hypothetical protein
MSELMQALSDTLPPEVALMATLLPEQSRTERRVRVALHLVLEHALDLAQLVRELDALAIWLCAHDDSPTGTALLNLCDAIREDVTR